MAMDPAAFAHSALGGLPYFDPMMFINVSGLCATTKLLQCRDFGIYQVDVSRKFQRGPDGAPDMHEDDFYARKRVIDQVADWTESMAGKKRPGSLDEWTPILYHFEIARSAAKRARDWGHIVFTDPTTTRFLIVMCFGQPQCNCGNPFHDDYDNLTKYQADRFMSLLTYLYHDGNKPKWVRATYTTLANKDLPVSFIDPLAEQPAKSSPPVFHVTAENFVPSLLPAEIEKIDNLLAQRRSVKMPPAELRQKVQGTKSDRPKAEAWLGGQQKNGVQCAFCDKVGDAKMPACSRCKLVRYCNATCQKAAWKSHKPICKAASSVSTSK
ncbi:hypothetical protein FA95DRAFT_1521210 [Auriscalpium vulgare]|uniref:Uncharacterized protein n=1 Tax=Auriscalpium vulgare TaxID=40419 RepID=A0ACB8RN56_9AGAM|nr:hypothetical protein FA95DRAFT_1521210 [Auriscalpium vulgare]